MSESGSSIYAELCYRLGSAIENNPLEKLLYFSSGITMARTAREPLALCDAVSARCCRLAPELQEDCYLCSNNYSHGQDPGAVRPDVDLLLECGEWLAHVQTDRLTRSSLLLLRRLAGQGVTCQPSAYNIVDF